MQSKLSHTKKNIFLFFYTLIKWKGMERRVMQSKLRHFPLFEYYNYG
jgi:hypothetical protein